MQALKYILIGIYAIVCFALIIVAMMQSKDDAGASGAVTGSSTNNFYENNKCRTRDGMLKKWTIILGVLFTILTIAVSIMYLI